MADAPDVTFRGGRNIAIKVPPHEYQRTVAFYRDVLKFPIVAEREHSTAFEFGPGRLWIDRVATASRAEVWLEVVASDTDAAAKHLAAHDVVRRDGIEPLPMGFDGFWIANPAGVVTLLCSPAEE